MKKIGIVGATGYTGEELLTVLARHSQIKIEFITSEHEDGQPLTSVFPHLPGCRHLSFISAEAATAHQVDLVFLCLPAGESVKWALRFLDKGTKVIDMGADFRFTNADDYRDWYNMDHAAPELLPKAAYGLPEWFRDDIKAASIVGNPGCYPTSALLALLPLLLEDLITDAPIIIDSKSGVSGAGKTPGKATHFVQVNENLTPYKTGRSHRHVGEIEHILSRSAKRPVTALFTPQLVPITRGLYSTMYVPLHSETETKKILDILDQYYSQEPFVQVLDGIPEIRMAAHTNYCFLGAQVVPGTKTAILFSAIDNLGKGASTQAIQNMNIMLDFNETRGLL